MRAQFVFGGFQNVRDLLLRQDNAHYWQPAPEIGLNHHPNARESGYALLGGDINRFDTSACKQGCEITPISEDERRTECVRRSRTGEPLEQRYLIRVGRNVVERVPDRDRKASAGSEHSQGLSKGLATVSEEHETELAYHRVESLILER
jgi:hypothetical protein